MLARIMRKWDLDDEPVPEAAALGEFVLEVCAGMPARCTQLEACHYSGWVRGGSRSGVLLELMGSATVASVRTLLSKAWLHV